MPNKADPPSVEATDGGMRMARLIYKQLIGDHGQLFQLYPGDVSLFEPGSGKEATYEDNGFGNFVTFEGTGFRYDQDGFLKHGTITAIHFSAHDGGDFAFGDQMK